MFAKFFTPFTSKDSNYKSNVSVISAANYLVNSICGTIYHNATSYIHSKITNKDKVLETLFSEPSANKQFPEDYAHELHKLHQIIPEIKFSNPNKSLYQFFLPCYYKSPELEQYNNSMLPHGSSIIEELKNPINTPAQLITMAKKWLRFQEELWGASSTMLYLPLKNPPLYTQYLEKEHQGLKFPDHTLILPKHSKCTTPLNKLPINGPKQAISRNTDTLYHETLLSIFGEPNSLKNLILILGLEYSFTRTISGLDDCEAFISTYPPNTLNSVEHMFHTEVPRLTHSITISTPLAHIAVQQKMLSEVSFLLTKDNVNCKSYNLSYAQHYSLTYASKDYLYLLSPIDTPFKIAIDNFDCVNCEILLEHKADPQIMVIPHTISRAINRTLYHYEQNEYMPLINYFKTHTPKTEEQTKSYIKIANLLSSYLDDEAAFSFLQTCESKIITVNGKEEALINHIKHNNTKPAHNTGDNNTREINNSNASNSGESTKENDKLPTTPPTDKNDPAKGIASEESDATLELIADINTISVMGDTAFPSTSNLAIIKNSFCNLL